MFHIKNTTKELSLQHTPNTRKRHTKHKHKHKHKPPTARMPVCHECSKDVDCVTIPALKYREVCYKCYLDKYGGVSYVWGGNMSFTCDGTTSDTVRTVCCSAEKPLSYPEIQIIDEKYYCCTFCARNRVRHLLPKPAPPPPTPVLFQTCQWSYVPSIGIIRKPSPPPTPLSATHPTFKPPVDRAGWEAKFGIKL